MKNFIFASLLLVLCSFKSDKGCLKADIILLADVSQSISGHEKYVYNALLAFIERFELSEEGIRMSLITFNGSEEVLYHLGSNKYQLLDSLDIIISKPAEGGTYMFGALRASMNEFRKRGIHYRRIIILVSDGSPSYAVETLLLADDLKNVYNSIIFGILVNSYDRNDNFMEQISSPNCYIKTEFETLVKELENLDICI